jgi:hypothetical protein
MRNAYRVLVGKPDVKKLLCGPRRRWENNIKIGLRGIGWGDMDWIDLAEDGGQWSAVVNTVMNLRLP